MLEKGLINKNFVPCILKFKFFIMKKAIFLLTLLTFSLNSFAPPISVGMQHDPYLEKIYERHCLINNNLVKLKDGERKTRKEVFKLAQPLLEVYLEDYQEDYTIGDSLSYVVACLFVSESSNRRGRSGMSTLWLDYSNPFGMTTNRIGEDTVTKMSWEMIKGKRVNMYRTFRTYESLEQAVESLMWDYLYRPRYERLRYSTSVKNFLYTMYKCGYMTNSGWSKFAYNEIYLKSI